MAKKKKKSGKGSTQRSCTMRAMGFGLVGVAVLLLLCFGYASITPTGVASDGSGTFLEILCGFVAIPFFFLLGYAAYILPLFIGIVGFANLWSLHHVPRGRWVVRGLLTVPALSCLLGAIDWIRGGDALAGGEVGAFYFTYLSRGLGAVLAFPAGLLLIGAVAASIWGAPPWTWFQKSRKKDPPAVQAVHWIRNLGRKALGLVADGARSLLGRKPRTRSKAVVSGISGKAVVDGDWTPPLNGNWTAGTTPSEDKPERAAGPEEETDEASFLPLPEPALDAPLPLDLLPDPPRDNPELSRIEGELSSMQDTIVEVVRRTTKVELVPSAVPPKVGLSFIRFEFGKEEGNPVPVTKIEKALKDLGIRTKRSPVRAELTDAIRFEFPLRKTERAFAPIKPLLEEVGVPDAGSPPSYLIGRLHDGSPMELDMREARHMLVGGTTGGGKTVLLHTLIFGLIFRYSPSSVRLALFDPKMLEFARYRGMPHLWQEVVSTPEGFYQLVDNLFAELQRRKKARVEDENARFPALVIIVDEFRGYNTDKLVRLIAEARALDMYFILATQHPTADVISTSIKANLVTGIAFRVKAPTGSNLVIGTSDATALMGKGDCLVQGPSGLARVQAGWVRPQKDLGALVDHLAEPDDED